MSKTIVVFHGHCPDGAAAAVVARRIARRTSMVMGMHERIDEQAASAAENLAEGGTLWMADIMCSRPVLDTVCAVLAKKKAEIGIYEHHSSNSWLAGYKLPEGLRGEVVFDPSRCGSRIFYESALKKHLARLDDLAPFIAMVHDRDMWLNIIPGSGDLTLLLEIIGDERFIQRFTKNASTELSAEEKSLLSYEKDGQSRRMHRLFKDIKIDKDPQGLRYGVMVGEGKASEVCNEALRKFDLDYVCLVDFNNGRGSIRSRDNRFDCAGYAAVRGGGGHPQAAGFPVRTPEFRPYP